MDDKTTPTQKSLGHRRSGVALVMTIVILSMLMILTVGFLSTMRIEKSAASSYEESQRAKLIAHGAVAHAIDILRTNIPEPARLGEDQVSAPAENWATNPGRLTVLTEAGPKYVPLHTGEAEVPDLSQPRDADSYDLNRPLPGQTTPMITGTMGMDASQTTPPMRVKWVNLQKDPSAPANDKNPLVGRYAFWMDDESSKINFNVALGKPANSTKFETQVRGGFMPPLFDAGDRHISSSNASTTEWALGRPQSVNLDILFSNPNQLLKDKLLAHTFLHGFARYPEAIMDYIQVPEPKAWFDEQKFNLTAYSRSPEFNVFGKSRLFTTYVPLSLEAGPTYQSPFVYDPLQVYTNHPKEILHLNSLLGFFGFTASVTDDEGTVNGGNLVNEAQRDMLYDYFCRRWPGYATSFKDKYGEAESKQIALNILLMARMATSSVSRQLERDPSENGFSTQWGVRTTSVNYSPRSDDMPGQVPERMYWRIKIDGESKARLMLPQMPGPYITEIRLFARVVPVSSSTPPHGKAAENPAGAAGRYIEYYYEAEYYMPPFGPVVDISKFPVKTDYLDIRTRFPTPANSPTKIQQQIGTTANGSANWNQAAGGGRLQILPPFGNLLGPIGSRQDGIEEAKQPKNRLVFRSETRTVGQRAGVVPDKDNLAQWDPQVYNGAINASVSVEFRFRPGMGVLTAAARPRQMIPLGEAADESLRADFTLSLTRPTPTPFTGYSWQIADPRLSSSLAQWNAIKEGPSADPGTMGELNDNEPPDNSSEKSKFRYLSRTAVGSKIGGLPYDRPDEYDTASRVSSPGYWSLISTGMQSNAPYRTFDLTKSASQDTHGLPDWILLDLFGGTYPMAGEQAKIDSALPDEFSSISYMNSTAGQINLNSRIYPQNAAFQPPARTKPLAAVFENLNAPGADGDLLKAIDQYQASGNVFGYIGEIANVAKFANSAPTQWERESLLRNMAGCLTTKSNTFGVWGVAQVVKKSPTNTAYDRFQNGDRVTGEKRFHAVIERYVWPGNDGLPGNAHVGPDGRWNRLAIQDKQISGESDTLYQLPGSPPLIRTGASDRLNLDTNGTYPVFDGPERVGMNPFSRASLGNVNYQMSTLEQADNPPQAVIKYRVVYFKYLDE